VFKRRGRKIKVYADKIVVSAGGIGSPIILRKSGIKEAGYNFFFDPLISVAGYVNVKYSNEIPMSAGILMKDEGYVMTDMAWPKAINSAFTAAALKPHRILSQKKALRIMVKIKDTLGGKISNRGGIRKKLTKEDKNKLAKGYARAKEILENAGAKGIHKTWAIAAHPGGTVKIGELVDSNLKTRYENLYVCDCSVIPEAWGLPPTLTILGLAKRLAKHLIAKDDKKNS
jgi:choline dehydrogenase-like flavoprotein